MLIWSVTLEKYNLPRRPLLSYPQVTNTDQILGIREFQFDIKYLSPIPGHHHELIRFLVIIENFFIFPFGFNFKMFWWILPWSRNYQSNGIISLRFSIWWQRIPCKSRVGNSPWNIKIEVDNKSFLFDKRNTTTNPRLESSLQRLFKFPSGSRSGPFPIFIKTV